MPDNMAHRDVVIYLLSLCCGKLLQSLSCILFILHFWDRVLCTPGYLGSLYVVENDPEFLIFQPLPSKFWDIRHRLPCWFSLVLGMGTKTWLCWTSTPLAELHPKPYTFPLSLLLWRSEDNSDVSFLHPPSHGSRDEVPYTLTQYLLTDHSLQPWLF